MLDYTKVESRLKSFLKNNKKLGYSVALLVSFLINGGFSYAVETRAELRDKIVQEQDNVSQMLKDADKSISNIELKIKKLTQRGEFWVKPLERSYQVAFITSFGNYTKNRNRTDQNFTEPEYNVPATNGQSGNSGNRYVVDINGITVLANNKATTGNSSSYRGNYNYNGRNLGEYGIVKNPLEFVDKIDFGASITPKAVTEKTVVVKTVSETKVTEPKVSVSKIDVSRVTVTPPAAPIISAPANPGNPSVNVTAPGAITPLGTITVAAIPAINVSVATPTVGAAPTVNAPTVATPPTPAGFSPKLISPPEKPDAPTVVAPTNFTPPALNFVGTGFYQSWGIGSSVTAKYGGVDSSIVIENYENYKTDVSHSATNPFEIITGTGTGGVKWNGKLNAWTTNGENKAVGGTPARNFNFSETLTTGSIGGARSAFINELRDHDAVIEGNYKMTYNGGDPTTIPALSYTKMFISYNPAGRNTGEPGTVSQSGLAGWLGQSTKRTATFRGTLELNGSPNKNPNGSLYEILVGVEHQLWDSQDNRDGYSNLVNEGDFILKSGYNVIGIMFDSEAINEDGRTKHNNNTANNKGRIIIKNENSIGIDFGAYAVQSWLPLDVTLGNIIVEGKNNYGFRMKNIGLNTYYDDVTVSGGGVGKTVTVGGKNNVGLAIGKSLSSNPQPYTETGNLNHGVLDKNNPISNFFGINVKVIGEETVGFLRLSDSSSDNTNDFVFNNQTMGIFELGKGAKNSTLIRTDKYGVQVRKDITSTGKDDHGNDNTGSGNTILHANGEAQHIHNYNKITVGKGFTQTTGMAATGIATTAKVNILNEGTIEIQGKKGIGMYVDEYTKGKSSGTIKMSGAGDVDAKGNVGSAENVGISNAGDFEFLGTLEVNGKKSSGIYNTGTTTISVGTNPTDVTKITATNGATALYSKGNNTKIESNVTGKKLKITVNAGTTKQGLAAYAEDKSKIILKDSEISITGGAAGVASFNAGTKIDLEEATLTYNGDGYAVYSDGNGEVNLKKTTINLLGSSTAFDVDLGAATLPTILDANTRINVKSDDVIAFNLKRATGLTTVGGIVTDTTNGILKKIEDKLGLGANSLTNLFVGSTATKYKVAAVDGGTITIGNLDKSGVSTDTVADKKDGYEYFNRFLAQRLVATTALNSTIKAVLTTTDATARYNGQVTGFEMNSSKNATTNAE
ncbi:autotransporter-associated N-terminal domain-containing protein, partial [Fusobacterium polymorphum]